MLQITPPTGSFSADQNNANATTDKVSCPRCHTFLNQPASAATPVVINGVTHLTCPKCGYFNLVKNSVVAPA